MKLGIAIFPADFAIRPDELARAVEERGFESLFFTDHTHIPATPQTRTLNEPQGIGVSRATLYAPSAGPEEVLGFLDDVAPLIDATKAA
jgi:alkanesulfonate monooxygenase SsuD/methylene tetrahydromethanopterin reductase-like flavin-dependent oxidoreductase (luciferase family)